MLRVAPVPLRALDALPPDLRQMGREASETCFPLELRGASLAKAE